jgi:hypothetical protein
MIGQAKYPIDNPTKNNMLALSTSLNCIVTYATGQREIPVSEILQSEERPMINQQFIEPFH